MNYYQKLQYLIKKWRDLLDTEYFENFIILDPNDDEKAKEIFVEAINWLWVNMRGI